MWEPVSHTSPFSEMRTRFGRPGTPPLGERKKERCQLENSKKRCAWGRMPRSAKPIRPASVFFDARRAFGSFVPFPLPWLIAVAHVLEVKWRSQKGATLRPGLLENADSANITLREFLYV
jgi:hypothetical protein